MLYCSIFNPLDVRSRECDVTSREKIYTNFQLVCKGAVRPTCLFIYLSSRSHKESVWCWWAFAARCVVARKCVIYLAPARCILGVISIIIEGKTITKVDTKNGLK